MVAEDDEATAGLEQVDGCREACLQRIQLLVHGDAQRLEHARGRVDSPAAARPRRGDALDELGELLGRLDRRLAPGRHDRSRDAWRERLLTEAPKQRGQLGGVERREQLRGRHAARGVEAHVERARAPEAESALRVGQLETRQAEVEQHAVDPCKALLGRNAAELAKVRLAKDHAVTEALQAKTNSGDGRPIGVQSKKAAIRRGRLQDPFGVPTAADRGVDLEAAGSGREHRNDLLRQHRQVPFLHQFSSGRRRIPGGS